jgi:hypothetical protein
LLSHFNSFSRGKKGKEEENRSSPPSAGRKSLGGKKRPYLLSFKLHSIKKRIALVRAYIPNL